MSELEEALTYLIIGVALYFIYLVSRGERIIRNRNPPPPANHVKPTPPPSPPLTHDQRMREREVAALESMQAPENRLAEILKANKHKFDIDRDGVIRIKLDHPEVIADMKRLMEECRKIKPAKQ